MSTSLYQRARYWIANRLGRHYAATISILDRIGLAFGGTFVTRLLASGVGGIAHLSYWHTAAVAGIFAAVAAVQGILTTAVTGNPTMASLVSNTMRARRDNGTRVLHKVPIRPTRKATR